MNSGFEYQVKNEILTPRLLMQLLGTECGRDIIHPNIWVNALMSEYKTYKETKDFINTTLKDNEYPNWVISDCRFPNELEAVKSRGSISIRVERNVLNETAYEKSYRITHEHESETALDNAEFDYTIDNNGSIEELIEKVKKTLIKEKII